MKDGYISSGQYDYIYLVVNMIIYISGAWSMWLDISGGRYGVDISGGACTHVIHDTRQIQIPIIPHRRRSWYNRYGNEAPTTLNKQRKKGSHPRAPLPRQPSMHDPNNLWGEFSGEKR